MTTRVEVHNSPTSRNDIKVENHQVDTMGVILEGVEPIQVLVVTPGNAMTTYVHKHQVLVVREVE